MKGGAYETVLAEFNTKNFSPTNGPIFECADKAISDQIEQSEESEWSETEVKIGQVW